MEDKDYIPSDEDESDASEEETKEDTLLWQPGKRTDRDVPRPSISIEDICKRKPYLVKRSDYLCVSLPSIVKLQYTICVAPENSVFADATKSTIMPPEKECEKMLEKLRAAPLCCVLLPYGLFNREGIGKFVYCHAMKRTKTMVLAEANWFNDLSLLSRFEVTEPVPMFRMTQFRDYLSDNPFNKTMPMAGPAQATVEDLTSMCCTRPYIDTVMMKFVEAFRRQQDDYYVGYLSTIISDPSRPGREARLNGQTKFVFILNVHQAYDEEKSKPVVNMGGFDAVGGNHYTFCVLTLGESSAEALYVDTLGLEFPSPLAPTLKQFILGFLQGSTLADIILNIQYAHFPDTTKTHQCGYNCSVYPKQTCATVGGPAVILGISLCLFCPDEFLSLVNTKRSENGCVHLKSRIPHLLPDLTAHSRYLRFCAINWLTSGKIKIGNVIGEEEPKRFAKLRKPANVEEPVRRYIIQMGEQTPSPALACNPIGSSALRVRTVSRKIGKKKKFKDKMDTDVDKEHGEGAAEKKAVENSTTQRFWGLKQKLKDHISQKTRQAGFASTSQAVKAAVASTSQQVSSSPSKRRPKTTTVLMSAEALIAPLHVPEFDEEDVRLNAGKSLQDVGAKSVEQSQKEQALVPAQKTIMTGTSAAKTGDKAVIIQPNTPVKVMGLSCGLDGSPRVVTFKSPTKTTPPRVSAEKSGGRKPSAAGAPSAGPGARLIVQIDPLSGKAQVVGSFDGKIVPSAVSVSQAAQSMDESHAPTPATEDTTPSAVIEQTAPSAVIEQTTPSAVIEQTATSAVIEQTATSAVTEQTTPSAVIEQTATSAVTEQTAPSAVTEKTASAITEQTAVVEKTATSAVMEQTTPSPEKASVTTAEAISTPLLSASATDDNMEVEELQEVREAENSPMETNEGDSEAMDTPPVEPVTMVTRRQTRRMVKENKESPTTPVTASVPPRVTTRSSARKKDSPDTKVLDILKKTVVEKHTPVSSGMKTRSGRKLMSEVQPDQEMGSDPESDPKGDASDKPDKSDDQSSAEVEDTGVTEAVTTSNAMIAPVLTENISAATTSGAASTTPVSSSPKSPKKLMPAILVKTPAGNKLIPLPGVNLRDISKAGVAALPIVSPGGPGAVVDGSVAPLNTTDSSVKGSSSTQPEPVITTPLSPTKLPNILSRSRRNTPPQADVKNIEESSGPETPKVSQQKQVEDTTQQSTGADQSSVGAVSDSQDATPMDQTGPDVLASPVQPPATSGSNSEGNTTKEIAASGSKSAEASGQSQNTPVITMKDGKQLIKPTSVQQSASGQVLTLSPQLMQLIRTNPNVKLSLPDGRELKINIKKDASSSPQVPGSKKDAPASTKSATQVGASTKSSATPVGAKKSVSATAGGKTTPSTSSPASVTSLSASASGKNTPSMSSPAAVSSQSVSTPVSGKKATTTTSTPVIIRTPSAVPVFSNRDGGVEILEVIPPAPREKPKRDYGNAKEVRLDAPDAVMAFLAKQPLVMYDSDSNLLVLEVQLQVYPAAKFTKEFPCESYKEIKDVMETAQKFLNGEEGIKWVKELSETYRVLVVPKHLRSSLRSNPVLNFFAPDKLILSIAVKRNRAVEKVFPCDMNGFDDETAMKEVIQFVSGPGVTNWLQVEHDIKIDPRVPIEEPVHLTEVVGPPFTLKEIQMLRKTSVMEAFKPVQQVRLDKLGKYFVQGSPEVMAYLQKDPYCTVDEDRQVLLLHVVLQLDRDAKFAWEFPWDTEEGTLEVAEFLKGDEGLAWVKELQALFRVMKVSPDVRSLLSADPLLQLTESDKIVLSMRKTRGGRRLKEFTCTERGFDDEKTRKDIIDFVSGPEVFMWLQVKLPSVFDNSSKEKKKFMIPKETKPKGTASKAREIRLEASEAVMSYLLKPPLVMYESASQLLIVEVELKAYPETKITKEFKCETSLDIQEVMQTAQEFLDSDAGLAWVRECATVVKVIMIPKRLRYYVRSNPTVRFQPLEELVLSLSLKKHKMVEKTFPCTSQGVNDTKAMKDVIEFICGSGVISWLLEEHGIKIQVPGLPDKSSKKVTMTGRHLTPNQMLNLVKKNVVRATNVYEYSGETKYPIKASPHVMEFLRSEPYCTVDEKNNKILLHVVLHVDEDAKYMLKFSRGARKTSLSFVEEFLNSQNGLLWIQELLEHYRSMTVSERLQALLTANPLLQFIEPDVIALLVRPKNGGLGVKEFPCSEQGFDDQDVLKKVIEYVSGDGVIKWVESITLKEETPVAMSKLEAKDIPAVGDIPIIPFPMEEDTPMEEDIPEEKDTAVEEPSPPTEQPRTVAKVFSTPSAQVHVEAPAGMMAHLHQQPLVLYHQESKQILLQVQLRDYPDAKFAKEFDCDGIDKIDEVMQKIGDFLAGDEGMEWIRSLARTYRVIMVPKSIRKHFTSNPVLSYAPGPRQLVVSLPLSDYKGVYKVFPCSESGFDDAAAMKNVISFLSGDELETWLREEHGVDIGSRDVATTPSTRKRKASLTSEVDSENGATPAKKRSTKKKRQEKETNELQEFPMKASADILYLLGRGPHCTYDEVNRKIILHITLNVGSMAKYTREFPCESEESVEDVEQFLNSDEGLAWVQELHLTYRSITVPKNLRCFLCTSPLLKFSAPDELILLLNTRKRGIVTKEFPCSELGFDDAEAMISITEFVSGLEVYQWLQDEHGIQSELDFERATCLNDLLEKPYTLHFAEPATIRLRAIFKHGKVVCKGFPCSELGLQDQEAMAKALIFAEGPEGLEWARKNGTYRDLEGRIEWMEAGTLRVGLETRWFFDNLKFDIKSLVSEHKNIQREFPNDKAVSVRKNEAWGTSHRTDETYTLKKPVPPGHAVVTRQLICAGRTPVCRTECGVLRKDLIQLPDNPFCQGCGEVLFSPEEIISCALCGLRSGSTKSWGKVEGQLMCSACYVYYNKNHRLRPKEVYEKAVHRAQVQHRHIDCQWRMKLVLYGNDLTTWKVFKCRRNDFFHQEEAYQEFKRPSQSQRDLWDQQLLNANHASHSALIAKKLKSMGDGTVSLKRLRGRLKRIKASRKVQLQMTHGRKAIRKQYQKKTGESAVTKQEVIDVPASDQEDEFNMQEVVIQEMVEYDGVEPVPETVDQEIHTISAEALAQITAGVEEQKIVILQDHLMCSMCIAQKINPVFMCSSSEELFRHTSQAHCLKMFSCSTCWSQGALVSFDSEQELTDHVAASHALTGQELQQKIDESAAAVAPPSPKAQTSTAGTGMSEEILTAIDSIITANEYVTIQEQIRQQEQSVESDDKQQAEEVEMVESKPVITPSEILACTECGEECNNRAMCCDNCHSWYHWQCVSFSQDQDNLKWLCSKCQDT